MGKHLMDMVLARAREALPEAAANAAFVRGHHLDDEALVVWLRAQRILPDQ